MYVAVKGGERANAHAHAHAWLAEERRGDPALPALSVAQIREQLTLAVNRAMAEGSLHDPDLAAEGIEGTEGVGPEEVPAVARPGGLPEGPPQDPMPRITDFLDHDGLIRPEPISHAIPPDMTRAPMEYPAARPLRLQALTRGDEGFVLGMAYSAQRGYGRNHPFLGELRVGTIAVALDIPELGFAIEIGEITLTECETVNQFAGSKTEPSQFTRGYGLVFGHSERKAISMALVDRALRWEDLGEDNVGAPAQDAEFVRSHADNIQATGFLEHIKLPHYVDFQSELELVRLIRAEAMASSQKDAAE